MNDTTDNTRPRLENPVRKLVQDSGGFYTESEAGAAFSVWLDTFVDEKGLDLAEAIEATSPNGTWNLMSLGDVLGAIKSAPEHEQKKIKDILVKIDFHNGDPMDFFAHLAGALAEDF